MVNKNKLQKVFFNTLLWFKENIPILLWVVLLISMLKHTLFFWYFNNLNDNVFWVLIADIIWSISAGNPINSYIIVSWVWDINSKIILITTFLVAWVTVWFLQIPAEIYFFWKKFAFKRNIISFLLAILIWLSVYFLIKL